VWVLRNREPARLERILLDGPCSTQPTSHTPQCSAPALTLALIHAAAGDTPDADDQAELLAEAEYSAQLLPVRGQGATGRVARSTHRRRDHSPFDRPHDLDLATLGSLIALSAAAAVKAGLMRAHIYSYYQAAEDSFEHGHKLPTGWSPRPSDAT